MRPFGFFSLGTVKPQNMIDSDDPENADATEAIDNLEPGQTIGYQRKTHTLFIEPETIGKAVDFKTIFGNDQPVELEVGSGKALFLRNAAKERPYHNFYGIEIVRKYAFHGADRVKNLGLTNVKIMPGDALGFLKKVPDRNIVTVHLYYPDPWWKRKHYKRRVFTTEFVRDVQRVLVDLGQFLIVTDVADYFEHVELLMTEFPEFERQPVPESHEPVHDLDYLTNFERKFRQEGRPIYRVAYLRKARLENGLGMDQVTSIILPLSP